MAGSTRYLRYIVLAFVALVVIFFISSSSSSVDASDGTTRPSLTKSATDILKKPTSLWKGEKPGSGSSSTSTKHTTAQEKSHDEILETITHGEDHPPMNGSSTTLASSGISTKLGSDSTPFTADPPAPGKRANATFVTLARNSDVWDISRSIRQVEDRFNKNYNYDWVFLNDDDFDETFTSVTSSLTSGRARYGRIGEEHWGFPEWVDQDKAARVREEMHEKKIIYGDSISYRHMCRYESGFFFRHPLMLEYEYYWRVEPSIELFCDVGYDPFVYMQDNNKKYSFVLSLYEYQETIPTLWTSTRTFMNKHPEHLAANNSLWWISEDGGVNYNNCHFWSNFEIGSLTWLRSDAYIDYFTQLDTDGGFFYERWGDAPVHSIAAALMLNKEEVHFFEDIAYYHVPFTHCPTEEKKRLEGRCHCDPSKNFDWNGYSCELQSSSSGRK